VLLPDDDYPLHQTALPLAHVMEGHPNAYDRFFFNGYREDLYFGAALGLYPNRGVIDGAFSVVMAGRQYSVFASDALVGRPTQVGPVRIDIVEPLRVNRVVVDAPEQGLRAELTYTQSTATIEEPRQTMHDQNRLFMDVTRATQLGTWTGWIETPAGRVELDGLRGSKDRSWGVRPVGEPVPGAPTGRAPQLAFFWAPLWVGDEGRHYMTFRDGRGQVLSASGGILPPAGDGVAQHVGGDLAIRWTPGTRWATNATVSIGEADYTLTPVLRFHMRGLGYGHPTYGHGKWHGGLVVDGEEIVSADVAASDYFSLHIQDVVTVSGPGVTGIGVLEQLLVGPYGPGGFRDLLDGAP
jgi:hypothetical protein